MDSLTLIEAKFRYSWRILLIVQFAYFIETRNWQKISTFHSVEMNSLNISAAQCYENRMSESPSSAERPSDNNHNSRSRWQNKIDDLY